MIRVALCDDNAVMEGLIRTQLNAFGLLYSREFELTYFPTGQQLLEARFFYDILFLDICLEQGGDGIQTGIRLRERGNQALFILLSSMDDRYKEGYSANVFRYLKKPLDSVEFQEAMQSALRYIGILKEKIEVRFNAQTTIVYLDEIYYVESTSRTRYVQAAFGRFPTKDSLEGMFSRLPHNRFFMPQKSFIINFEHVLEMDQQSVVMRNRKEIAFVRGRFPAFNQRFTQYLGGE